MTVTDIWSAAALSAAWQMFCECIHERWTRQRAMAETNSHWFLTEASSEAADAVSRRVCERLAKDGEIPHVTVSVAPRCFHKTERRLTLYSMQPTWHFTA